MNTCVTCKHWDPYFGQASNKTRLSLRRKVWAVGDCLHAKFPRPGSSWRGDHPATQKDFGCTLWEEIPDV